MRERSDGKATREAILEAAEAEFAACGYDAASTRRICARAGVNVALVNRYFGSKENLYRVVAKRLFGDLGAPMAELPASVQDAEGWRTALRMWVEDFLFMTLPTQKAQKRCAALFRQEVTHPRSSMPNSSATSASRFTTPCAICWRWPWRMRSGWSFGRHPSGRR